MFKFPPRWPELGIETFSGKLSRVTLEDFGVEIDILTSSHFFNRYLLKKELILLLAFSNSKYFLILIYIVPGFTVKRFFQLS